MIVCEYFQRHYHHVVIMPYYCHTVSMSPCVNLILCHCNHVSLIPCMYHPMSVSPCVSVTLSVSPCVNVTLCQCYPVPVSLCQRHCFSVTMCHLVAAFILLRVCGEVRVDKTKSCVMKLEAYCHTPLVTLKHINQSTVSYTQPSAPVTLL